MHGAIMHAVLGHADCLLRGTGLFDSATPVRRPWWLLPVLMLVFAPVYGAVMGTFGLDSAGRLLQVTYSAIKVPLLLMATTALCLPGFFVLNTVCGLRQDFAQALQAILAGQAGLGIVLASLCPFTRFFYFSSADYNHALLFNAAAFALAAVGGQMVMFRYYRVLIRQHAAHRIMLYAWLVLYAFVGIQMGWTLRPFIGAPGIAVTFFRDGPFTNAYVVVARLIARVFL
jgi:hypothetical protein